MTYYPINEDLARAAKRCMSFDDYKEGSATAEYRARVDEAIEIAERQKKRVDTIHYDRIDRLLDAYASRLAANLNRHYAIMASCPSIMITGGSNFPVKKKERQNEAERRNMQEYDEIKGLLDKIKSVGMGGISSDDPNALEKLEAKLNRLELEHQTMKAVNAFYRKHGTLDGCPDITEDRAAALKYDMKSSWHFEDKPFESFKLKNSNAEIKRLSGRIRELKKRETDPPAESWDFEGGEAIVSTSANRLQLIFNEKPEEELRQELKRNGFRWAPSVGAWQRQLTPQALAAARRIKALEPI